MRCIKNNNSIKLFVTMYSISIKLSFLILALIEVYILSLKSSRASESSSILCPKVCLCDDSKLQTICNQPFGGSGLPHVLSPFTRKIITNSANMNSLVGMNSVKELEYLDIALNKYTTINFNAFENNTLLVFLNASHNLISYIGDINVARSVSEATSIIQAEALLNHTKVTFLNVVDLYLNNNKLTTIKSYSFVGFKKLETLDLSNNIITSLEPYSLTGLYNLRKLYLKNNQLTQIPAASLKNSLHISFQSPLAFSKLLYLDLSFNRIEKISSNSFEVLSHLNELHLNSNRLSILDRGSFKGLVNLALLSLSNNILDKIQSNVFQDIRQLKHLQLSNNPIENLDQGIFEDFIMLQELFLNNCSYNRISSSSLGRLRSLTHLEISNNKNLTSIQPSAFSNLRSLVYLNLSSNALTTIHNDFVTEQDSRIFILDVSNNPLECDCDLKWLTQWLKSFSEVARSEQTKADANLDNFQMLLTDFRVASRLVNISCSGPPFLKDHLVIDLPENKLECLEPDSELNLRVGFGVLYIVLTVITVICTLSFCNSRKQALAIIKDNIINRNGLSSFLSYKRNLNKNFDDLKNGTQLYTIENDAMMRRHDTILEDSFSYSQPH